MQHAGDVEPVPTLAQNDISPARQHTGESISEKGHASSSEEHGKYASSERDVEAVPAGEHEKQPLTAFEQELYAEIGAPVNEKSKFGEKVSILYHSRAAVVLRDFALIAFLLGIWLSSLIRPQTQGLKVVTSVIAWFFTLLILLHNSRYIPQRPFVQAITYVWGNFVERPWTMLPYYGKLAAGWGALLALFLGTAFGIPQTETSTYARRGVALAGIVLTYLFLFAISHNRSAVKARTTILGLGLQMALGLFIYKTQAGIDLFQWIATAAADLLKQAQVGGATFFWSAEIVGNFYFFVNVLSR